MIRLDGVSVRFEQPGGDSVLALDSLTLDIPTGQFLVVVGTNGSGKSTLLNAIAGKIEVDRGRILVGDNDLTDEPEWERARVIGRVFQNPFHGTCSELTVAENLHLAAQRGRRRGLKIGLNHRSRADYRGALQRFNLGLEKRLDAMVGTLSGGQRQALTLLMATLTRPEVLLLDEHTAALDPRAAEQIMRLSADVVASAGLTAVMVTHSLAHAAAYGDRTLLMHRGRTARDWQGEDRRRLSPHDLTGEFERLYLEEAGSKRKWAGPPS